MVVVGPECMGVGRCQRYTILDDLLSVMHCDSPDQQQAYLEVGSNRISNGLNI